MFVIKCVLATLVTYVASGCVLDTFRAGLCRLECFGTLVVELYQLCSGYTFCRALTLNVFW